MPRLDRPLTKRIVDALPCPTARTFFWEGGDGAVKGFGCKVDPSGRKVFVFQYDDAAGATKRITLGAFGAVTVDQARAQARQLAADAAAARNDPTVLDPARARAAVRTQAESAKRAQTMAELFDLFLADRERRGKKSSTLAEYRRLLGVNEIKQGKQKGEQRDGTLRAALGTKRVADVVRRDVKRLHVANASTPAMANRYVAILGAVFRFAEVEELRAPGTNPCKSIELYAVEPRRQSLREEEYHALGAALETAAREGLPSAPARRTRSRGMSAKRKAKVTGRRRGPYKQHVERTPTPQNPIALALLRFLALSGWRSGEAKALRWADVDLGRSHALLPDTKTGRSSRPLGSVALAVLEDLRASEGYPVDGEWVFPGADPTKPISEVDHVWAAVRHAANLGVTLHGLRHAFTTEARWLGYGDHVIAKIVGHLLNDSQTSRYGDVPDVQVREAAEKVSRRIATMLDTRPARVLPFRSGERVGGTE
ncbi:MAG TPA: integrase family protein [Gemmatimonadaceae bacterium]|nr:integrase family protein [Gemmatimonadaceae bacterium]